MAILKEDSTSSTQCLQYYKQLLARLNINHVSHTTRVRVLGALMYCLLFRGKKYFLRWHSLWYLTAIFMKRWLLWASMYENFIFFQIPQRFHILLSYHHKWFCNVLLLVYAILFQVYLYAWECSISTCMCDSSLAKFTICNTSLFVMIFHLKVCTVTVSYTHLTLPTIYSV